MVLANRPEVTPDATLAYERQIMNQLLTDKEGHTY